MNDQLIKVFNKHDKEFFTWLHNTYTYTSSDLSKLPYSAQIGIIDEYLYTIHSLGVIVENNKPKLLYYNFDNAILSSYTLDVKTNDSFIINKVLGIVELTKNKYLPF